MHITGGNATVYVADLDRAIDFYTSTLRLELRMRSGDAWAEVIAGEGLTIGLHRVDEAAAAPAMGSIRIGLHVEGPLDEAVAELTAEGVAVEGPVADDGPVRLAHFNDPDGNPLYLWEFVAAAVS